jgi:hypothetical protein
MIAQPECFISYPAMQESDSLDLDDFTFFIAMVCMLFLPVRDKTPIIETVIFSTN